MRENKLLGSPIVKVKYSLKNDTESVNGTLFSELPNHLEIITLIPLNCFLSSSLYRRKTVRALIDLPSVVVALHVAIPVDFRHSTEIL